MYKKQIEYLGGKATITVDIDYMVEKRLNGLRYHRVILEYGTNITEVNCQTHELDSTISSLQKEFETIVNSRLGNIKSEVVIMLEDLGFEKGN